MNLWKNTNSHFKLLISIMEKIVQVYFEIILRNIKFLY